MQTEKIYTLFKQCSFKVCTDSRKITPGCLFVALKGENFNGNKFAVQAIEQGASFALIDEPAESKDERLIKTENCLIALQQLANFHRKQLNIPVLAIGGSNGKTTTKELISSVLKRKFTIHVTPGNFNNHIGLPLTILNCPLNAEILVLEMGANHAGEIEELCKIAEPSAGLITNIGKEHLEGFGSIEGVAKAESELYQFLHSHGGKIFVNMNDEWLRNMSKRFSDFIGYGTNDNADLFVKGKLIKSFPEIEGLVNGNKVFSHLPGDYNFENILAAVSVGLYFKVDWSDITTGIASYLPENNRSQHIKTLTNTILLDAYNANPSSMQRAIDAFTGSGKEPKVLILGDMFELGEHAQQEHLNLLNQLSISTNLRILLAGEVFYGFKKKFPEFEFFKNTSSLKDFLLLNPIANSYIFIKGSRGMALEKIVEQL